MIESFRVLTRRKGPVRDFVLLIGVHLIIIKKEASQYNVDGRVYQSLGFCWIHPFLSLGVQYVGVALVKRGFHVWKIQKRNFCSLESVMCVLA